MLDDPKSELEPESLEEVIKSLTKYLGQPAPNRAIQTTQMPPQPPPLPQVEAVKPLVNFGWEIIDKFPAVPYIYKGSKQCVAERICSENFFRVIYKAFGDVAVECIQSVKRCFMTENEAETFNEINQDHCDRTLIGSYRFQTGDPMFCLNDLKQILTFFRACHNAMRTNKLENDMFGFVKMSKGGSEIPFVWKYKQKWVPLFYFDGQSDYLEERCIEVTDTWSLIYLKFCFLIQRISKKHYAGPGVKMVKLEHIRNLFEPNTSFELCWPKDCNQEVLSSEAKVAAQYGVANSNPVAATNIQTLPKDLSIHRVPQSKATTSSHYFSAAPSSVSYQTVANPGASVNYNLSGVRNSVSSVPHFAPSASSFPIQRVPQPSASRTSYNSQVVPSGVPNQRLANSRPAALNNVPNRSIHRVPYPAPTLNSFNPPAAPNPKISQVYNRVPSHSAAPQNRISLPNHTSRGVFATSRQRQAVCNVPYRSPEAATSPVPSPSPSVGEANMSSFMQYAYQSSSTTQTRTIGYGSEAIQIRVPQTAEEFQRMQNEFEAMRQQYSRLPVDSNNARYHPYTYQMSHQQMGTQSFVQNVNVTNLVQITPPNGSNMNGGNVPTTRANMTRR